MTTPFIPSPSARKRLGLDPDTSGFTPSATALARMGSASDATRTPASPRSPIEDIDQRTGAPDRVRLAIAAAGSDADRLAVARRLLPGVQETPMGLAFTREDGTLTLIEPGAFSRVADFLTGKRPISATDVATSLPDVLGLAGNIAGGAAGAAAGGVPGAVVGGGAGNVAGRGAGSLLVRAANRLFGEETQDTRAPGTILAEGAGDFVAGAAGEIVGPAAKRILPGGGAMSSLVDDARSLVRGAGNVRRGLAGGPPVAAPAARTATGAPVEPVAQAALARDIPITLPMVSESPTVQGLAGVVRNAPTGAAMRRAEKAGLEAVDRRLTDLAAGIHPNKAPLTKAETGAAGRRAVESARASYDAELRRRLDRVETAVGGAEARFDAPNTRGLLDELRAEVAKDPETLGPQMGATIKRLEQVVADAGKGAEEVATGLLDAAGNPITRTETTAPAGIRFSTLRSLRSALFKEADNVPTGEAPGMQSQLLKRASSALEADIAAAVESKGIDAQNAYRSTNRFIRLNRETAGNPASLKVLDRIIEKETDEQVYQALAAPGRSQARLLGKVRRGSTPEEWDALASGALYQLGRPNTGAAGAEVYGASFDPALFMRQWGDRATGMTDASKAILFGGERFAPLRAELDALVPVIRRFEQAGVSPATAGNLGSQGGFGQFLLSPLGWANTAAGTAGATAAALTGAGPAGIALGGVGSMVALNMGAAATARLWTNPRYLRWLKTALPAAERSTRENAVRTFGGHLGRLWALSKNDDQLRSDVREYIAAIRAAGAPVPDSLGTDR